MRDLPTGTVSMLFSDIEGSTLLLTRLGRDYTEALDRHRGLLRSAWAAGAGIEMSTEGDSFFVVFPTADGAVRAAVLAQRGLEAQTWPGGEHIRVRIGIHTGTPQLHDGDYVGMDVHRAARVAAAAHGGQIVLTSATAELAGGLLPEGVRLKDLGTHHLKDLPEPERVFQLAIEGLREDFPALRSLGASSNLPIPTTPLVGREPAVSELSRLVDSRDVRLVTLTGPGGSGKTRLAIEVAARIAATFPDGVFFVPLAAVADAEVMWTSIADVLALPRGARSSQRLLEQVAQRAALFVFDNIEQLHGADDVVTQLVEAAPSATIITTSRRALGVPGEHLYPVPPLPLPVRPTLSSAKESPAVELFVQQARRVRPDFRLTADNVTQVVAICRHLDGLPLAIELSAARIRLLSPQALLRRIDQSLDVAARSRQAPSRQRTLRNTIAWSYHLLSAQHQAFFRRLGVFAGGADLDAVAAVSAGISLGPQPADPLDLLAELVDASLVVMSDGPDGEPRITLLETIRSFARDQLRDAGELAVVHSAHALYYLQVAERLQRLRAVDHLLALHQAETELDNFREALAWAIRSREDPGREGHADGVLDLRLSTSLGWLWYTGGYVLEGSRWLERALDRAAQAQSGQLAEGLALYANLLITQGDLERAGDLALRSLTMARVVGDDTREAYAMVVLGTAQLHQGDVLTARQTFEDALALNRRIGDPDRVQRALGNLAGVEEELGNFAHAEELTQEALGIVREAGDAHEVAVQSQNLAHLLTVSGRAEEAAEIARSLIDSVLQLRSPNLTMAFANTYMNILLRLGDPIRAAQLLGSEQAMRVRLSLPNPHEDEEFAEAWMTAKDVISPRDWELEIQRGRETELETLLASLSDR